jgi:hypothetical protein
MSISGSKLLSGRWIWCVVGAFVFAYLAMNQLMPASDVKMILAIIVTFYFTKDRTQVYDPLGEPGE